MFRNLLIVCFVLQFFLSGFLCADDTYWDAHLVRSYVHNSELQRRWAWRFLAPHLRKIKGNEHVLDIGCGDGRITADISNFIPEGSIIGIDPSLPMLAWATKQYSSLEYPNLSFYEGGFLEPRLDESFDLIFSNCALQHCSNQSLAFDHLAKLLKPGGLALISVPAFDNLPLKQSRKNVQSSSKWAAYWQKSVPRKFLSIEEYSDLVHAAGLHLVRIEKIQTVDPFIDREELLNFLLGTFTPAVPANLEREFFNEWIDEYLRLLPQALHENGVIEVKFGRIEIEAVN